MGDPRETSSFVQDKLSPMNGDLQMKSSGEDKERLLLFICINIFIN